MSGRGSLTKPLAYMGVWSSTPPDLKIYEESPTQFNSKDVRIGDLRVVKRELTNPIPDELWYLARWETPHVARWLQLYPAGAGGVPTTITADDLNIAVPNLAHTIEGIGGEMLNTTATIPNANSFTINLDRGLNTQVVAGNGVLLPAGYKTLQSHAGTVILDFVTYPGAINFEAAGGGGGGCVALRADVGNAVVDGLNTIGVKGGDNIHTAGALTDLTVHLDSSVIQPFTNLTGNNGVYALGVTNYTVDRFLHGFGFGGESTYVGRQAGNLTMNPAAAQLNTGCGAFALTALTQSPENTALGWGSLMTLAGGLGTNVACGAGALQNLVSGAYNIALGRSSGSALIGAESSNVYIANAGVAADSNTIRIGLDGLGVGTHDQCYLAGTYDQAINANPRIVVQSDDAKLGTSTGAPGQILVTNAAGAPVWSTVMSGDLTVTAVLGAPGFIDFRATAGGGGGGLSGLESDGGVAVLPDGVTQRIRILGGDNINTTGDPALHKITVNLDKSIYQPNSNAAGTEGYYCLGGLRFLHNYGDYCTWAGGSAGNRTHTADSCTGIGYRSLISLTTGNYNTATGRGSMDQTTTGFQNSSFGYLSMHDGTGADNNCAFGYKSLTNCTTATSNCAYGSISMELALSATGNVAVGYGAGHTFRSNYNTGVGYHSLYSNATGNGYNTCLGANSGDSISTGGYNTSCGATSLAALATGSYNSCFGSSAGSALTLADSSNLLLATPGAVGDVNTIRIGYQGAGAGQQNKAYCAGIYGALAGPLPVPVFVGNNGKLGYSNGANGQILIGGGGAVGPQWANITAGSGISITNALNAITINAKSLARPSFLGRQSVTVANKTGDGTLYYLGADALAPMTEIFDVGGNFNPGGGIACKFTAPATGKYHLGAEALVTNLIIPAPPAPAYIDPLNIHINGDASKTSLINPILQFLGTQSVIYNTFVNLAAGDIVTFSFGAFITGVGKTLGIGANHTLVWGYLVEDRYIDY